MVHFKVRFIPANPSSTRLLRVKTILAGEEAFPSSAIAGAGSEDSSEHRA